MLNLPLALAVPLYWLYWLLLKRKIHCYLITAMTMTPHSRNNNVGESHKCHAPWQKPDLTPAAGFRYRKRQMPFLLWALRQDSGDLGRGSWLDGDPRRALWGAEHGRLLDRGAGHMAMFSLWDSSSLLYEHFSEHKYCISIKSLAKPAWNLETLMVRSPGLFSNKL